MYRIEQIVDSDSSLEFQQGAYLALIAFYEDVQEMDDDEFDSANLRAAMKYARLVGSELFDGANQAYQAIILDFAVLHSKQLPRFIQHLHDVIYAPHVKTMMRQFQDELDARHRTALLK